MAYKAPLRRVRVAHQRSLVYHQSLQLLDAAVEIKVVVDVLVAELVATSRIACTGLLFQLAPAIEKKLEITVRTIVGCG